MGAERGGRRDHRDHYGGLVSPGPTQLSASRAMRARDVSRPRPEDIEAALNLDEASSRQQRGDRGRRSRPQPAKTQWAGPRPDDATAQSDPTAQACDPGRGGNSPDDS